MTQGNRKTDDPAPASTPTLPPIRPRDSTNTAASVAFFSATFGYDDNGNLTDDGNLVVLLRR